MQWHPKVEGVIRCVQRMVIRSFCVQPVAVGLHHCWDLGCATDAFAPVGYGRDLEFGQRASNSSLALREVMVSLTSTK